MANMEFLKLVFRDNLAMGLPISTPMLLEVLCLTRVSEMPRLKSYQGSTDQACTIWQRGLLYFVVPWRAYSHRVVQIQESAR